MSKALYAVPSGADPRILAELASLRARVRELEEELARERRSHPDALAEEFDITILTVPDPALV